VTPSGLSLWIGLAVAASWKYLVHRSQSAFECHCCDVDVLFRWSAGVVTTNETGLHGTYLTSYVAIVRRTKWRELEVSKLTFRLFFLISRWVRCVFNITAGGMRYRTGGVSDEFLDSPFLLKKQRERGSTGLSKSRAIGGEAKQSCYPVTQLTILSFPTDSNSMAVETSMRHRVVDQPVDKLEDPAPGKC